MTEEKKNINILYVEDDMNLGFVVKEVLEEKGYSVKHCMDGDDAIQKFGTDSFQLCILDIMLPNKDGFAIADEIRELNEDIPIIFLTAKTQTEDVVKKHNGNIAVESQTGLGTKITITFPKTQA